jgi:hypothetical protein
MSEENSVSICHLQELGCRLWVRWASGTTGFGHFAERDVTLAEQVFPLGEAFIERKLSATVSRRRSTGEELSTESMRGPSRRTCAERPTWLSVKVFSENKKKPSPAGRPHRRPGPTTHRPPLPPPPAPPPPPPHHHHHHQHSAVYHHHAAPPPPPRRAGPRSRRRIRRGRAAGVVEARRGIVEARGDPPPPCLAPPLFLATR